MGFVLQAQPNPHTRECSMDDLAALRDKSKNPDTAKFYEQAMRGLEIHQSGIDMAGTEIKSTTRQPGLDVSLIQKPGMSV